MLALPVLCSQYFRISHLECTLLSMDGSLWNVTWLLIEKVPHQHLHCGVKIPLSFFPSFLLSFLLPIPSLIPSDERTTEVGVERLASWCSVQCTMMCLVNFLSGPILWYDIGLDKNDQNASLCSVQSMYVGRSDWKSSPISSSEFVTAAPLPHKSHIVSAIINLLKKGHSIFSSRKQELIKYFSIVFFFQLSSNIGNISG